MKCMDVCMYTGRGNNEPNQHHTNIVHMQTSRLTEIDRQTRRPARQLEREIWTAQPGGQPGGQAGRQSDGHAQIHTCVSQSCRYTNGRTDGEE